MNGEYLFLDDQTRHQFYSQQTVQKFLEALTIKNTELLKALFWRDVVFKDKGQFVLEGKETIYGQRNVIGYFEHYLRKLARHEGWLLRYAILPGNKPAILCTKYIDWQYQMKEVFSIKLVENKIIEIERSDKIRRDMIVAE